jgi:YD repeat-containing protein
LFLVLAALVLAPGVAGAAGKGTTTPKPTVVKELTELRTESSKTYLLSNGARQLEIYAAPIHFKDGKGSWQEIDTSLVPTSDGGFASKSTPANIKFSKKDKGAPVVSLDYQGASITLSMMGHDFGAPKVSGGTASYPEANAAIDSNAAQTTSTSFNPLQPLSSPTTVGILGPFEELAAVTTDTYATTSTSAAPQETTTTTPSSTTTSDTTSTTLESTTTTAPASGSEMSLSYQVTSSGVKEDIVLTSADAPATYSFTIKHPGLICKKDKTGQWGFYDTEENPYPLFALENLEVYDSSQDANGDPVYCPSAVMTVDPGADESTVTYTVPSDWLSDPARVFPVTIDPTVTLSKASGAAPDTWISSGYPGNSYGTDYQAPIGYLGSPYNWITGLFKFTLPTDLTSGGYVQSAHFQVYQYYQSTSSAQVARASAMTQDWSESSTYTSLGGHTWFGSDTRSAATTSAQAQWIDFDFTTAVQQWANGGRPNYGFTMYQSLSDKNQPTSWWRRVYTSDYTTDTTKWPKLVITYTAPISVASYGATGTNIPTGPNYSDDTTAFQNAINAVDPNGGVVTVPVGTYYVSGLSLTNSNVVLQGAGTSSIILPNPNPHPAQPIGQMIQIGGTAAVSNITVQNLYLRVPQGGYGVRLSGSGGGSAITVSGLTLAGGGDSSTTQALSVASGFTNLSVQNNDLTTVSAVPVGVSVSGAGVSVSGNFGPYEPYRADFYQGTDQYDTAIRLSKARFPQGAPAAVVVPGDTWQEAMTAAPLAHAYGGPVLCTQSSGLDSRTLAELQRLGPTTVYVIGLTTTISSAIADALPASTVTRLAGSDIYGTAAAVATQVKTKLGSVSYCVLVASDYWDTGISVGAIAGYDGYPVLFSPRNGAVPTTTVNEIKTTLGTPVTVACGINPSVTISGVTIEYMNQSSPYDACGVAADFNQGEFENQPPGQEPQAHVGLATASNYSDALALGAYMAQGGGVLFLTNDDTVPQVTKDAVNETWVHVRTDITYLARPNLWAADENAGAWQPVAPRHTSYDFDAFADHQVTDVLDHGALNLSTTDLAAASFGPEAALTRTYSSSQTTSRYFAPGWMFGFDRHIQEPEGYSGFHDRTAHYIDEQGDDYVFFEDGAVWLSPPGFTGTLRGGEPLADGTYGNYALTLPGGDTLSFDSWGNLTSETDTNGNTVSYAWQYWNGTGLPTGLTITAANGQQIAVTFQVVNYVSNITQATYTTANGTRTVTYATAAPWTVTYSYTGTPSMASHSLTYAYTGNQLSGLTATAFTGGQDATESYSYTSGPESPSPTTTAAPIRTPTPPSTTARRRPPSTAGAASMRAGPLPGPPAPRSPRPTPGTRPGRCLPKLTPRRAAIPPKLGPTPIRRIPTGSLPRTRRFPRPVPGPTTTTATLPPRPTSSATSPPTPIRTETPSCRAK